MGYVVANELKETVIVFVALQLLSQTWLKRVCIACVNEFCAGNCRFSFLFSPCSGKKRRSLSPGSGDQDPEELWCWAEALHRDPAQPARLCCSCKCLMLLRFIFRVVLATLKKVGAQFDDRDAV